MPASRYYMVCGTGGGTAPDGTHQPMGTAIGDIMYDPANPFTPPGGCTLVAAAGFGGPVYNAPGSPGVPEYVASIGGEKGTIAIAGNLSVPATGTLAAVGITSLVQGPGISLTPNPITGVGTAANAGVLSIGGVIGAVPLKIQTGSGTANTTTGDVTITFGTAFTNIPTGVSCDIATADTTRVYTATRTALSKTAVTYNIQCATKILGISLGLLTIWGPPPANTTVSVTAISPTG